PIDELVQIHQAALGVGFLPLIVQVVDQPAVQPARRVSAQQLPKAFLQAVVIARWKFFLDTGPVGLRGLGLLAADQAQNFAFGVSGYFQIIAGEMESVCTSRSALGLFFFLFLGGRMRDSLGTDRIKDSVSVAKSFGLRFGVAYAAGCLFSPKSQERKPI